MKPDSQSEALRARILDLVAQYAEVAHAPQPFEAGRTPISISGKVIGAPELKNMVEASLDGWLTSGRFNDAFEKRLDDKGIKYSDFGDWAMTGWKQIFFYDPDGNVVEVHQAPEGTP